MPKSSIYNIKILVCGAGSIGRRHIENLKRIGVTVLAWRSRRELAERLSKEYEIEVRTSIDEAIRDVDGVVVATTTDTHIEIASKVIDHNKALFIEKPLSVTEDRLDDLGEIIKNQNLIIHVGCNLRFHFGPVLVQKFIKEDKLGDILWGHFWGGMHLPDWHPGEDYRLSYASRKKLGGGVVLTQIHEIDYLYWFFGKVSEVFAITGKMSNLDIDVEDYCESLLKFKNNVIVNLHLDYFQRPAKRTCKIIGTEGQILWNWENNHVQIYKNNNKKWITKKIDKKMDRNKMYVDELKYFLDCVNKNIIPMNSIIDAIEPQKISLAIKESAKKGQKIKIIYP